MKTLNRILLDLVALVIVTSLFSGYVGYLIGVGT